MSKCQGDEGLRVSKTKSGENSESQNKSCWRCTKVVVSPCCIFIVFKELLWRYRADLASFLLRVSVQNGSVERNPDLSLRGPPKFRAQCRSHFFQTGQNPQGRVPDYSPTESCIFPVFSTFQKIRFSVSFRTCQNEKTRFPVSFLPSRFQTFPYGQNGLISVPVTMQREVPDSLPDRFLLCTNVLFSG